MGTIKIIFGVPILSSTIFVCIIASYFGLTFHIMLFRFISASYLLIVFTFFCCSVTGQTPKIDSLSATLIQHIAKDTIRVNLLNKIAYETFSVNMEDANKYAMDSYTLAKELGYDKGLAESMWLQGITCVQKNPGQALIFFESALKIAEKENFKHGIGKYTNAIGTVLGATGRDSLAVSYYLKAIEIAQQANDSQELGKYLINLSQSYNRMGKIQPAIEGYSDALEALKAVNDKNSIALCYNSLGNIYTSQGNYPIALESFQNGLKIREELKDMRAVSRSLISIGSIYFAQKNYEKALEYNQRVVEIAGDSNDKHTLAGCLLNIGLIYLNTNNEYALEYFLKALEISNNLTIIPLQISIHLNIGQYYYNQSEFAKANESFVLALELSKKAGNKSSICYAKLQIARVYNVKKQYSSAMDYAQKGLEIAKSIKHIEAEKNLHQLLSEIYASTYNYRSAYNHSQLFKQLSDSLFNASNVRQIAEMEFTYKFEQEKQAIALEQQKKDEVVATRRKLQRKIILVLAVCCILVSMLAIYIHRLYRFNKRANLAIQQLEQEKKRFLEQEIERVNQELEQNQKSLTAASLKLIQNSERDAETVRRLETIIDSTTPEGKRVILAIIADFKRISRSSNWNEFELLFQKVHRSFYEKLNESFPNLTANERKLCAFLKLNMSSKDIANITFQSEEALKKARQRLRQKIGIERDTNLVVFLQNI